MFFFQMEIVMKLGFCAGLKLVRYFCRLTFIIYIYIHLYPDIPISLLLKSLNKPINPWFPSLKTHAFGSDANPTRVVHGALFGMLKGRVLWNERLRLFDLGTATAGGTWFDEGISGDFWKMSLQINSNQALPKGRILVGFTTSNWVQIIGIY